MAKRYFTSECVTEGHPDKLCDQISDAVLDSMIADDPDSRVAIECVATTGMVFITGEVSTKTYVDISKVARETILEIGYDRAKYGFDGTTCAIVTSIKEQSKDIAMGVDSAKEHKDKSEDKYDLIGAGDQGMMFGFACKETPELMPLPISLAAKLAKQLTKVRKDGLLKYLRPDGKTQVTVQYDEDKPVRLENIVISTQHDSETSLETIHEDLVREVIKPIIPKELIDDKTEIFVNPTGRFVIGGPMGDAGLTGRKIIVDTYGGYAKHGGGAFSGKDPTKVDRSASYAARYVAKNLVASGICDKAEVGIAYAIGVARPLSVDVNTFGGGKIPDEKIRDIIQKVFDLRPLAIIDKLDLRKPIYKKLAAYGHFGREDLGVKWEQTDKADEIRKLAGI